MQDNGKDGEPESRRPILDIRANFGSTRIQSCLGKLCVDRGSKCNLMNCGMEITVNVSEVANSTLKFEFLIT